MKIMLFGSSNPSGSAFLNLLRDTDIETWGRKNHNQYQIPHVLCDLSGEYRDQNHILEGILVSFAPIWLVSSYLDNLSRKNPDLLRFLEGVVACSSSSFLTKRFSFNTFDQNLSSKLSQSHLTLKNVCQSLSIPCKIIAPTLVYGRVNDVSDKNLSKILQLMRTLPFIVLPRTTGLRQPIHASQLARAMKHQVDKITARESSAKCYSIITLGGDEILSYEDMILQLKKPLHINDPAKRCKVFTVPNQIFYLLALPILLFNPKVFESVMRIQSNLSGFTKVHEILNTEPQMFPVSNDLD
jgi:hypothetical protein